MFIRTNRARPHLDDELTNKAGITAVYFDMSGVKGEIIDHGDRNGFFSLFVVADIS
jgi:hypothetical protein